MSDPNPNEAVERLRKWSQYWIKPTFAVSAPLPVNPMDVDALLAERGSLLREAKAFRAMVEHRWRIQGAGAIWNVWSLGETFLLGKGTTPLEAVEAAVKGLEKL